MMETLLEFMAPVQASPRWILKINGCQLSFDLPQ